jgi:hypothetical protein
VIALFLDVWYIVFGVRLKATDRRKAMKSLKVDTHGLPPYQCHKKVWAGEIMCVDNVKMFIRFSMGHANMEGTVCGCIDIDSDFLDRNFPISRGDYIVIYENGYVSISPKKAFEEGYTLVDEKQPIIDEVLARAERILGKAMDKHFGSKSEPNPQLEDSVKETVAKYFDFHKALKLIFDGKKVRIADWNPKSYIHLKSTGHISFDCGSIFYLTKDDATSNYWELYNPDA